jgi:ACS family tartrate transporter-like MFS transporter
VYGLGAGIFFLGYALFEVPSNLILVRVGARRWIARIAITWGVLAAAMMLVRSAQSFYALRFLLGVAEAGYFPGIIYYLSHWFPERQRARAISRFMIGVPLTGLVGGPLGGALLALNGRLGLAGWQWLFLVEGLPAVVLGVLALGYLTERPEDAHWLAPAEREWLRERLEGEQAQRGRVSEASFRRALANPTVWWLSVPYITAVIGGLGFTLWVPVLIKELLRVSDQSVGLITGGIGLAGVAGMLLNGAHSDGTDERVLHAAAPLLVAALGFVERRRGGDLTGTGAGVAALIAVALVLGALEACGSIDDRSRAWWPGLIVGPAAAGLGFAAARSLFVRVRRRLDAEAASALPLYGEAAALAAAGASILFPPLAVLVVAGLAWLLVGGRRRAGEKYAGLRILR